MESMSSLKVHVTVSSLLSLIVGSTVHDPIAVNHALILSTQVSDDHHNQQVSSVQHHNTTDVT
jgi:hypothetical protein